MPCRTRMWVGGPPIQKSFLLAPAGGILTGFFLNGTLFGHLLSKEKDEKHAVALCAR